MKVQYQNVNYDGGNQSSILVFESEQEQGTDHQYVILIDAGPGLDLSEHLSRKQFLSATLLTHAHTDHIVSLDNATRDNAPIYATPETSAIVERMLQTNAIDYGISNPTSILDSLTPIQNRWEALAGGEVHVLPVPVGHTPGAAGFVIHFDGQFLFVTGDFTTHDVAGNPGFDPSFNGLQQTVSEGIGSLALSEAVETDVTDEQGQSPDFSIDAVHLNASTDESSREDFQDAVEALYQQAVGPRQTLVAASSFAGIHLGRALNQVASQVGNDSISVTLVGKTASLYQALEYDDARITATQRVKNLAQTSQTDDSSLTITPDDDEILIAGPQSVDSGTSNRLVTLLSDCHTDPAPVLFQVGSTPRSQSSISRSIPSPSVVPEDWEYFSVPYSQHPSEDRLESLLDTLNPAQVIISHITNESVLSSWSDKAREFQTIMLSAYGEQRYCIYDNGWVAPSWVNKDFSRAVLAKHDHPDFSRPDPDQFPSVGSDTVSLSSEGVQLDPLEDLNSQAHNGSLNDAEPVDDADVTTSGPPQEGAAPQEGAIPQEDAVPQEGATVAASTESADTGSNGDIPVFPQNESPHSRPSPGLPPRIVPLSKGGTEPAQVGPSLAEGDTGDDSGTTDPEQADSSSAKASETEDTDSAQPSSSEGGIPPATSENGNATIHPPRNQEPRQDHDQEQTLVQAGEGNVSTSSTGSPSAPPLSSEAGTRAFRTETLHPAVLAVSETVVTGDLSPGLGSVRTDSILSFLVDALDAFICRTLTGEIPVTAVCTPSSSALADQSLLSLYFRQASDAALEDLLVRSLSIDDWKQVSSEVLGSDLIQSRKPYIYSLLNNQQVQFTTVADVLSASVKYVIEGDDGN